MSADPVNPGTPPCTQRSVIVVSDLHLGGNEDHGTMARFCRFLDALDCAENIKIINPKKPFEGNQRSTKLASQKKPDRLCKPEKIILLGDFLEFWDSKDQNRDNVFFDALFPLLKLRDLDLETIYVTGNHDEDIQDLIRSGARLADEKGDTARKFWSSRISPLFEDQDAGDVLHGLKICWNHPHSLRLHSRSYAPFLPNGKHGIEKGGITYSFLHGHQFDKEQVTATLDQGFSQVDPEIRCDIIDYFEDVANISVAKAINPYSITIMLAVLVFLLAIFWGNHTDVIGITGMVFGLGLIFGLAACAILFGVIKPKLPSSRSIALWSTIGAIALTGGVVYSAFYQVKSVFEGLFLVLFGITLYISVAIILPCFIACIKRRLYTLISKNPKNRLSEILTQGTFDPDRYSYRNEVLVFGHTHMADVCHYPDIAVKDATGKSGKSSLVWVLNTGCWVRDPRPPPHQDGSNGKKTTNPEELDTFVYIDDYGVSLMSWKDRTGEVICLYTIRNWLS